LYNLGQSLRSIPTDKIAFFTLPNFPRSEQVPGDTANVLWTQPEDNQIFASFRDDVPASSSLFHSSPPVITSSGEHLVEPSASGSATSSGTPGPDSSASGTASPTASGPASPTASGTASPAAIQARTASQSICAG
jgi:hypothetical protein